RPKLRPARGSAVAQTSSPGRPTAQGKFARTLVSLSPFIAIAAFFLTRSWLAFLLIPVIAILARAIDD
ncbi:MAG: hypothetical protein HOQ21_06305, partial [Dermatophilaceae bacterium]|nr:hypothetical protein [Dermatophilaceae bacterium]